jgi:hypothetical protein
MACALTTKGSNQKEVISDLKRENQFLSKEIWLLIGLISGEGEIYKPVLKLVFTFHDMMNEESLHFT